MSRAERQRPEISVNASNVLDLREERAIPQSRQRRDDMTTTLLRQWDRATGRDHERLVKRLVEINMPVAQRLARHYAGRGLAAADLEQVACLGLVSAARRYDPSRGDDFLAYAVPTIKGELRKAFRDVGWVVRPPRRLQELQAKAWTAEADLVQSLGRAPSPREIADHLDVPEGEILEILGIDGCFAPSSLDVPLGDGESTTVADRQGNLDDGFASCEARTVLGPLVRALDGRDRRILELRFFRGWTQQQIGDEIGVTQMQVSRLLSRIFEQLRAGLVEPAA